MAVVLSGRGTIAGGSTSVVITFSTAFSSVPTVILLSGTDGLNNDEGIEGQNVNMYMTAVSATQVTVNVSGPAEGDSPPPCYFDYRAVTT